MINNGFCIGEIVWGRVKGWSAWPGKIVEIDNNRKYLIKFYGESSQGIVTKNNIFPYNTESLKTRSLKMKKNTSLLQAMMEAEEELLLKKQEEEELLCKMNTTNEDAPVSNQNKVSIMLSLHISEDDDDDGNDKKDKNDDIKPLFNLQELEMIELDDDECQCFLKRKTNRDSKSNTVQLEDNIIQHLINYLLCIALEYQAKLRDQLTKEEQKCLSRIFAYFSRKQLSNTSKEIIRNAKADILIQYILNKIDIKELNDKGISAYINIYYQLFKSIIE